MPEHCFHNVSNGSFSNNNGTYWWEKCCWCGEEREVDQTSALAPGHGDHIYVARAVKTFWQHGAGATWNRDSNMAWVPSQCPERLAE